LNWLETIGPKSSFVTDFKSSAFCRIQTKDWMRLAKVKNFIKRASKTISWLAYFGINLPHPYRTSSAGPNAGGSTFKTSVPKYSKNNVSVSEREQETQIFEGRE